MTNSIDTVHAFIGVDHDGEGIAAFLGPDGVWMPMVAADPERIKHLRPIAQDIATISGKRLVLAKFSVREDLEVINP